MNAFAILLDGLAAVGAAQAWVASALVARFAGRPAAEPRALPPVTVLKPLYGDEALLEEALASFCTQDYPDYQIIFGLHARDDTALPVARRVAARFPGRDITLIVDPTEHGRNRKVGNLINMLPAARHDLLLIADSDIHVQPDYLRRLVAALETEGVGLATTLYAALAPDRSLPARLGALQITGTFLPGAMMARALGRQDCLGASMMLHRRTLERAGGLAPLADHVADDNLLGRRVRALGLSVALADTVPATTVAETSLRTLLRHELRWSRTIRALAPLPHVGSAMQYPIGPTLLALAIWPSIATAAMVCAAWAVRAAAAARVARALRPRLGALAQGPALRLLPLRDVLSLAVMAASFAGRRVDWRGQSLRAEAISAIDSGSALRGPAPRYEVVRP